MSRGKVKRVRNRKVFSLIISGLILFFTFAIVLVPLLFMMNRQQHKVQDAKIDYARGQTLLPLYAELKALPLPDIPQALKPEASAAVNQDAFDGLPEKIHAIAEPVALEVKGFNPRLHILGDGKKYMLLDVVVTGAFASFQEFLTELSRFPSFYTMQKVVVRKLEVGDELGVQLWLNVQ